MRVHVEMTIFNSAGEVVSHAVAGDFAVMVGDQERNVDRIQERLDGAVEGAHDRMRRQFRELREQAAEDA